MGVFQDPENEAPKLPRGRKQRYVWLLGKVTCGKILKKITIDMSFSQVSTSGMRLAVKK